MNQELDRRDEMLLKMYVQMFDDIKTQTQILWQAVTVVIGSFALLSLVEKAVLPLDVAAALLCVLAAWLCTHTINASYWYNRNLVIIANIERQFLQQTDLRHIHYYFGKHRKKGSMETSIKLQFGLGVCVGLMVTLYHFSTRVVPGIDEPLSQFELVRALPYGALVASLVWCVWIWQDRNKSYTEFLINSPGVEVNTDGIAYGVGHPSED